MITPTFCKEEDYEKTGMDKTTATIIDDRE
jgi:hypothetical protein